MSNTGTAATCKDVGHCLHEGTAAGSFYCCKCGEYIRYEDKLQRIRQSSIERYGEAWKQLAEL